MNSTVFEDISREDLALETAKCLKNIFTNTQNLTASHKELLEVNLSLRAYIEESKSRLSALRLDLARTASGSQEVVKVLNEKCEYIKYNLIQKDLKMSTELVKMSSFPPTPQKRVQNGRSRIRKIRNTNDQPTNQDPTKNFVTWYKHMIDYERQNFCLYLSDSVTFEWFGRTIRTRKKVSAFLNYDMQCTRHDFRSIQSIEKIQSREERDQSSNTSVLATPLTPDPKLSYKRKLRSNSNSPQWDESCKPIDIEFTSSNRKRLKTNHNIEEHEVCNISDISSNGDGLKRKRTSVTPTNVECGQGDCLPSTSDSDRSQEAINGQLQKLAVECNGYVEFTRSRNNNFVDTMKWDRKCKVQVSYSEDPLNVGEYIIWGISYSDESKCRRNLLAAFEEAANEE